MAAYAPDNIEEEQPFTVDMAAIRVWHLNVEDAKRGEIIGSDPEWLRNEADKDAQLRGRVLVNICEKFRVDIRDPKTGNCLMIDRRRPEQA